MRYYAIKITDPKTGNVITPPGFSGLLGGFSYTSYINGATIPGAWNVELDIPAIGQATPQGFGLVRIWGISLQEISQANQLGATSSNQQGKNIQVFGGMQKGLPLANPNQAGLLAQGMIFQAFGNWILKDMTLDMVIMPGNSSGSQVGGVGTLAQPKNIVLNWTAGATLASALATTLSTAFPGVTQNININSGLVRSNTEVGYFPTLEQLAQYVKQASLDIIKTPNYPGVSIVFTPNNILMVSDSNSVNSSSSTSSSPKQIAFQDLIGQPTWLEGGTISMKTVMRSDLAVGDSIMLPPVLITNTQQASSNLVNQQATFKGGFYIISARHVGNFRQPSADAWVTVYEAAPLQPVATL